MPIYHVKKLWGHCPDFSFYLKRKFFFKWSITLYICSSKLTLKEPWSNLSVGMEVRVQLRSVSWVQKCILHSHIILPVIFIFNNLGLPWFLGWKSSVLRNSSPGQTRIVGHSRKVSHPWNYWHGGSDNLLFWGTVLCFVGCLQHPWPLSIRYQLTVPTFQLSQSKMSPDLARCAWGAKSPKVRTTDSDANAFTAHKFEIQNLILVAVVKQKQGDTANTPHPPRA